MAPPMTTRPRIACSFSGGRTSAYMVRLVKALYGSTHDILVTFANTGCEHEATLEFVRDCDQDFGFNTVWMEAVTTHGQRVGMRPKIVTFETASRNGEPFEQAIKKYGVFCKTHPQCTSRLKTEPMEYYLRGIVGWEKGAYQTAIGIRADELDRCSTRAEEYGFIYPLVKAGVTKARVLAECATWAHDLKLPGEHYGNCTWCWKKSARKLMTLAVDSPEVFDFPRRMEARYASVKASKGTRQFFRGNKTVDDIFRMAQEPFTKYADASPSPLSDLDLGSACGESCEIGADDVGYVDESLL